MGALAGTLTGAALLAIAGLHGSWAVGGHWPAPDRSTLAQRFVGPGKPMPGTIATWSVAALVVAAAVLVLGTGFGVEVWFFRAGVVTVGVVLALRGIAGLAMAGAGPRSSAFARLNLRIISPLCFLLAAGSFASLV